MRTLKKLLFASALLMLGMSSCTKIPDPEFTLTMQYPYVNQYSQTSFAPYAITTCFRFDGNYHRGPDRRDRAGRDGRHRFRDPDLCIRTATYRPSHRCDANDRRRYHCSSLYAGCRRIGFNGKSSRTVTTKKTVTNHPVKSVSDLSFHFCCRDRPCGLFRTPGNCRSRQGNQNTSGTPAGNSRYSFPTSHNGKSDLCGNRRLIGLIRRL